MLLQGSILCKYSLEMSVKSQEIWSLLESGHHGFFRHSVDCWKTHWLSSWLDIGFSVNSNLCNYLACSRANMTMCEWNRTCLLPGWWRSPACLQSTLLPEEHERCILHWTRHLSAVNTQRLNFEPLCYCYWLVFCIGFHKSRHLFIVCLTV